MFTKSKSMIIEATPRNMGVKSGNQRAQSANVRLKKTETVETVKRRLTKSFNDSSYYSSDHSSYLQDEPFDLMPKTDYTYARSESYRLSPNLSDYVSPNMSRRRLRGSITLSPELRESYSRISAEELDSQHSYSYSHSYSQSQQSQEDYSQSQQGYNQSQQIYNQSEQLTHGITSTNNNSRRRRRRSSSTTEYDEDGMVLRSGSRLHSVAISSVIDEHDTGRQSTDRKSMSIMQNNAIRQRLQQQPQQQSIQQSHQGNYLAPPSGGSYYRDNRGVFTTIRKTLVEQFEETEYEKGSRENSSSAKHSRLLNGNLQQRSQNIHSNSESTSVNHMYGFYTWRDSKAGKTGNGLDSDEDLSDSEVYRSSTTKSTEEGHEQQDASAMNIFITTVVTTVVTTVETISSVFRPVVQPLWNTVCKPVVSTVSPAVYALVGALLWVLTRISSLVSSFILLDYWLLSRLRKNRRACCCCIPLLLLLLLLPFLLSGLWGVLTKSSRSYLPLVLFGGSTSQTIVNQNLTSINLTVLTAEVTRIMISQQQGKGEQLSHGDVEAIVRVILREEMDAWKLTINEQNNNFMLHQASYESEQKGRTEGIEVKLDVIIAKYEQLALAIQDAKDAIKLESSYQRNFTSGRLKELEEQLFALRADFTNLDLNYHQLSASLRNCCRNDSFYLTTIRGHVDEILAGIMAGYGKDESGHAGFAAWLKDNFVSRDHFQSQIKDLGEDISTKLALLAASSKTEDPGVYINQQGNFSDRYLQEIIDKALWKFHSDKTGIADYALESAGGSVVNVRCSRTYYKKTALFSVFGIPLWYTSNSARTLIQPDMHPGQCWPFHGRQGYVVIETSAVIVPTAFSLEHIPKSIAPGGDISSAPKDFTVLGLANETDSQGISLGNYTYSIDGAPLQYFPIQKEDPGPFKYIELRILDNHGNKDFTCVYRFRIHGDPHKR